MNDTFSHRPPRIWTKVTITVAEELSDITASFLAELTGSGVEQSMVQPGAASSAATVTGYLEHDGEHEDDRKKILHFIHHLTEKKPDVFFEEIIEEDWGKNWKKHFKPIRITDRITIKPTWEPYQAAEGEIIIEIDPGLAFGTGLHASTRLALFLIEAAFVETKPQTALDVGTGTGILAMAAAFFGAPDVTAIDNDPDAVVCALENVTQNGLDHAVTVSGADLTEFGGPFDLVIANITSDVLTLLAPLLHRIMSPGGKLVLAGILTGEQAQSIKQTFTNLGLSLKQSPIEGEWQAFLFSS
ncbi:MAG: 50S ribosomal protein L11 methyltransferase [Pseudomonadota bacterium]